MCLITEQKEVEFTEETLTVYKDKTGLGVANKIIFKRVLKRE